jgi:hypothetical protein
VRARNYGQAVRTDRWRYIQWSDGNMELYDELKDPEETHDVSSAPENVAAITELKTLLKQRSVLTNPRSTTPGRARRAARTVSREAPNRILPSLAPDTQTPS